MILTKSQRKQYGITGRPLTRLPKIGERVQYAYRRDDGTLIHHKATVVPYYSPSAKAGELVLIRDDNPLTREFVIWDFELKQSLSDRSPFYAIDTR